MSLALHLSLTHLEHWNTHVRMLFIDFGSAFNTIIPQQLIGKLKMLGLNTSTCDWFLDFLTKRPQIVQISSTSSNTIVLNTGTPLGCVLSLLLFRPLTHDCTSSFSMNHIKFADDTTVIRLIRDNDDASFREELHWLAIWCKDNNLSLNDNKTKEVIADFRKPNAGHPCSVSMVPQWRVRSTKFLFPSFHPADGNDHAIRLS